VNDGIKLVYNDYVVGESKTSRRCKVIIIEEKPGATSAFGGVY